jgi:prepilin-type processing-associated H-X9-DG protein
VLVWPYVEQGNYYVQFDQTRHFYQTPNTYTSTTDGIYAKFAPMYFCPSDRDNALWQGDIYWRSRGNYVVCWGNQEDPYDPTNPLEAAAKGTGVFGHTDLVNRDKPRKVKLTDITDGTSNTLLMSEVVMAANDNEYDIRGDFLNDDYSCTMFMTLADPLTTPNAGTDRSPYCRPSQYPRNPPCEQVAWGTPSKKSARSKHTGGVNTLFGDGSIRFVRNGVAPLTWMAMGTMNGGEVVQND